MAIFETVFTIALSTALVAAGIVALDWDLAVARWWQSVMAPYRPARPVADWSNWSYVPELKRPGAPWRAPAASDRSDELLPEWDPALSPDANEAERWLAAASSGRLSEYVAGAPDAAAAPPAVSLQEALAARQGRLYPDRQQAA